MTARRTASFDQTPAPREVLRCPRCRLNQFRTESALCRRCRKPLDAGDPAGSIGTPQPAAPIPFCERLRRLRTAQGLTGYALARLAGYRSSKISRMEGGGLRPNFRTRVRLAHALGITVIDLMTGVDLDAPEHERAA